ncbi:hypothetical protein ABPG72_021151 [Tetrahymena utriculariae]
MNNLNFQLSVQLGTPSIEQQLTFQIGQDSQSDLGQFIFDSSIKINDNQFYQQYLSALTLYNMKMSSSADISPQIVNQPSSDTNIERVQGNIVTDILQVGNTKFKFTFLCASQQKYIINRFLNGATWLNRISDNIFDIMYSQDIINTRDYLMSMQLLPIADDEKNKKLILRYDLDQKSDIYQYPSEKMIQSDRFAMKAYGVQINGKDVIDKLKTHLINFDRLSDQILIPFDLYTVIRQGQEDYDDFGIIGNCIDCKCSKTKKLPKIKVITQEYIFEITPEMYTKQINDSTGQFPFCQINLGKSSSFQFTQQILLEKKISIMYQKEISSLKFVGAQTTTHLNIKNIMIALPLLNGASTPPIDQYLIFQIGLDNQSQFGQFIFDSSIKINDSKFYEQYLRGFTLYNMEKSSSADINPQIVKYASSNTYPRQYIQGNIVTDLLQIGNTKFNYTFLCASQQYNLFNTYFNGVTMLNRLQDNIFDEMYSQHVIQTRDYLISMELFPVTDYGINLKKLSIRYDLDQRSDNYNYPSNIMINSDMFAIKAYGIYLNGEDVTDKIKNRQINFDNFYDYLMIPDDLYTIVQQDQEVKNMLTQTSIYDCKDCKCSQIQKLPKIKVITQEYMFEITPEMYTYYILDTKSLQQYTCQIILGSQPEFRFAQQLLSQQKLSIMYQKEISSLKFVGAQTITHVNILNIIITLSLLNGACLVSLIFFAIKQLKQYRSIKLEYFQERKYKLM